MIVMQLTEHHLELRLKRLVGVYTCQNVKLLEISCHGSDQGGSSKLENRQAVYLISYQL